MNPDSGTVTPQPVPDSGPVAPPPVVDAGSPSETIDAGTPAPDAGTTASLQPGGLGQGPFPMDAMTVYGASQGLDEQPVSASVDEASNLWVVSAEALYLLTPGSTHFHKYTAADGLHLGPGYTEPPDITMVEGGKPNECFVGYYYHDTNTTNDGPTAHTWQDPAAHMGKMDQVLLQPDGTLKVNRYDFHNTNDWHYYESRTVMGMVYDHFQHPHNLYVSTNHGIIRVLPDNYLPPLPDESIDSYWFRAEKLYYADHLHPVACLNGDCNAPTFGDFFGLTLADDGRLWMGGLTTAGAVHYVSDMWNWMQEGTNPFDPAIGYDSTFAIWPVPAMGDAINLRGVAVTPDGTVWFASGEVESWRGKTYGLASLYKNKYSYYDPTALTAAEYNILEIQALSDGRIVLGFPNSGLLVYTPGDAIGHRITSAQGLPGEQIGRMSQDKLHDPPILFVPTNGGLAAFRSVP